MTSHTDAQRDAAIDALFNDARCAESDDCMHHTCEAWRAWNAPAPQEDAAMQLTDNPHKSISNSDAVRFYCYCGTELTLMETGPLYGCPGGVSTLRCLKCDPLPEPDAPHPQAEERCSQCGESERDGFHDEDPEQAAVDIACCPQGTLEDMMRIHRFVPAAETNEGVEGDGQRSTDEIARDLREQKYLGIALSLVDEAADRLEQLQREYDHNMVIADALRDKLERENAALRKTIERVIEWRRRFSNRAQAVGGDVEIWRDSLDAALADGEKP